MLVDLYANYNFNPLCNEECGKQNSICEDGRLPASAVCPCLSICLNV